MEMDDKRPYCPKIDIDGFIEKGKQFDLDIILPEDNRNVIYGVVKNCFKEPVEDAVIKLVEIVYEYGKKERLPVTHTFTDKHGEFVFGPLCPDKEYAIEIFVNDVKHIKICAKGSHETKCLKGKKMDKCDCFEEKCEHHEDKCKKCEHCEEKCQKCEHFEEKCKKCEHCEEKCKKCEHFEEKCKKEEYYKEECQKCK